MGLIKIECTKDELTEKLESTRWAIDFSWNQLCGISAQMDAYTATKGTIIYEDGSRGNTMGIVVKGSLDIVKQEPGKPAVKIAAILPSQSFGEMSLIDGEPRSAQIIASTDVELLFLTKDGLLKLVDGSPSLAFKLLWMISFMMSQRLRKTSGGLLEHLNKD